jgi:hypothetical protein
MSNQRKCHACGKWTDITEERCVFCDTIIDPVVRAKEEKRRRDEIRRKEQLEKESKIERYLRKLQESEIWYHQLSFKILNTAFTIYMGILSFFIWLIALISG